MLQRVVRLLGAVVSPIVVVAAPEQELPPLPAGVIVARDEREGRGPLEGLLAGLTAIAPHADAAYATSCDVPLLVPAFVEAMIAHLADPAGSAGLDLPNTGPARQAGATAIAVSVEGEFHHPLAAVYRTSVVDVIAELLAADQLRPVFLFDRVATCRVSVDELRAVDPRLDTLRNLNFVEDYFAALVDAGLTPDPAIVRAFADRSISPRTR
jgi:molybdopterin-guanine dinucleotide biosynthesis protein A